MTTEKERDPRIDWSTSALLAEVLRLARADETRDSDELGDLLSILRVRGDRETLDAALELGRSSDPVCRQLAAACLNDLGHRLNHPYQDESTPLLSALCADTDPAVVESALYAALKFGNFDARVIASCAQHADDGVRLAVARALCFRVEHEVLEALPRLMTDPVDDVRDWATFGLGAGEADSAVIRSALTARLTDEHYDTRCEAIAGLAKRGVAEVIPFIERELDATSSTMAVEAAEFLADPRLVPALERLDANCPDDADIARALAACRRPVIGTTRRSAHE